MPRTKAAFQYLLFLIGMNIAMRTCQIGITFDRLRSAFDSEKIWMDFKRGL